MAKLYFSYGVMNSGKSMQLLATAYNFHENNIPFLLIKSSIDTRDEGVIKSRCLGKKECILINPEDDIIEKLRSKFPVKWILVDEAQFLTEEQVDQLANIVDYMNINVKCYGLRSDFQKKLFPGSKRLFELSDSFDEIKTTCKCGKKAVVNARVDKNGEIITEGEQIEVGAEDKYITLCRTCYNDMIYQKKNKNNYNLDKK